MKNIALYILAGLLGGLHALSFAPVPSGMLQVSSLTGLLLLLSFADKPVRAVWAFAVMWFCAGLYWLHFSMHEVGGLPIWMSACAIVLLSVYLSSFYVLAVYMWRRFFVQGRLSSDLLAFPALWMAAELARGYLFGGFPWLASGYAHIDNPILRGWFAIFGVYGVGFLAAVFAGGMAFVARQLFKKQRDTKALMLTAVSMLVMLGLGWAARGLSWGEKSGAPISVSIVQPNVSQTIKFDEVEIIKNTHRFIDQSIKSNAQLTVFPETALPYPWTMVPEPMLEPLQAALKDRVVLMGGVGVDDAKGEFYNSGMWLSGQGDIFNPPRYDKIHLLPFGEMVPWGFNWFIKMMNIPLGGYGYGVSRQPFELKTNGQTTRVGVNICYENEFGEELIKAWVQGDAQAPNIWVNMTNLGWFGSVNQSTAQQQHLYMSRARALEMARPVIVATNTGLSAYIDAAGTVLNQLPADEASQSTVQVQGMTGLTPYVGWGNAPVLGFISFLFGLSVFLRHRQGMDI